ncbi:MAG: carbon-nitrogen family hydrolase [Anaerolineae bacterium]|nr:MAG: carbon-nitrogen family hydrolase [Anaerolineae bacterium]
MSFAFGDVEANFARAAEWIAEAAARGADLVLLPELWASGYDLPNWPRYAAALDDEEGAFGRVAALARQHGIAVGGSLLEARHGKAYNTFALFGPQGERWGVYRKVHLFCLLEEEKWLAAGDELVLAETPWGAVGMAICYDLRFPELCRHYAVASARLILIPAEWPATRVAHWSALLKGRAIENQCYVAGVNKVGESQSVRLGGHSAVVDPWGETLVEGDFEEALLTVEIDLREAEKARRFIPVFRDRRPELYG